MDLRKKFWLVRDRRRVNRAQEALGKALFVQLGGLCVFCVDTQSASSERGTEICRPSDIDTLSFSGTQARTVVVIRGW